MRPNLNDARIADLTEDQQRTLKQWRNEVVHDNPQYKALWIVGERGTGSSHIAKVIMRRMVLDHELWSWEWNSALELITATRNQWDTGESARQHPQDYGLWQENDEREWELNFFWNKAEIVCIDDLHSTLDIRFWRKHLQERLEQRVKEGRVTIVATDMSPNHREFEDIQKVITNLFTICDARR